ncbi:MAG: hypothetical protein QOI10_2537 [Solirubrobacterales bacterium]|jgi:hypothetical protein|nr:hypothetical protein [Solirubrobacterales bacterium]
MTDAAHNRREALRRGTLAAGALAASGLLRPALAAAQASGDDDLRDFLVEAIGLEQVTVLAYTTAIEGAGPDLKPTLTRFRDQEQAHANALRQALDQLGFDAPDPPDTPTDTGVFDGVDGLEDDAVTRLSDLLGKIGDAKGTDQFIDLLTSLENDQLTYYGTEGPKLDSSDLSTTAAEIGGCQAQHLVYLGLPTGSAGDAAAAVARTASQAADEASSGSTSTASTTTTSSTTSTSP